MVVDVTHSTLGLVKTIGLPVKFSATPSEVRWSQPEPLGQAPANLVGKSFVESGAKQTILQKAAAILFWDDGIFYENGLETNDN